MIQKYTKGNLEVLHSLITKRIAMLQEDTEETKDIIGHSNLFSIKGAKYGERLNRLDDECSFLEDLAECIEDMLERGEGR